MRTLTAFFTLSLATLVGCGLIPKKADADDGGGDSAVAAVVVDAAPATGVPTGKNASAVARFGTEVQLNEAKVIAQTAQPRTNAGSGTVVATLKPGTPVTRIATNAAHSLIVFSDPNVPTDNLMGWVSDVAFTTFVATIHDAGPGFDATVAVTFACPPGKVAVVLTANHPICKPSCTADKECKGGHACTNANALNGGVVRACVSD